MQKYQICENLVAWYNGTKLYRIQALTDFGNIEAGDIGGWVASEKNLSQVGMCWLYDNSKVFGNAKVLGDSKICDTVVVCDNAVVDGNAMLFDEVVISGRGKVHGSAILSGMAMVSSNASVGGTAWVKGDAHICRNVFISHGCVETGIITEISDVIINGRCKTEKNINKTTNDRSNVKLEVGKKYLVQNLHPSDLTHDPKCETIYINEISPNGKAAKIRDRRPMSQNYWIVIDQLTIIDCLG